MAVGVGLLRAASVKVGNVGVPEVQVISLVGSHAEHGVSKEALSSRILPRATNLDRGWIVGGVRLQGNVPRVRAE